MSRPSPQQVSRVMAELGRRGGKATARTRSRRLSPERRSEIARHAALARWARREPLA